MKRKISLLSGVLSYSLIPLVLSIYPTKLFSQNGAVMWSALDMGFGVSASSNSSLKTAVGQGFIGATQQMNVRVESGFLANTLLRGTTVSVGDEQLFPLVYSLRQNYPNPFNPFTSIEYVLPRTSFVSLKIYNVLGEEVAALVNGAKPAGIQKIEWQADGFPSGVYFYRLQTGDFVETKKLILLR